MSDLQNPNPVIQEGKERRVEDERFLDDFEKAGTSERDEMDAEEIFDMIRDIRDPEHGELSLEELSVTRSEYINIDDKANSISLTFTPTIPHCSMVTLIGLCIRVKLLRSLPPRFHVDIAVTPGTHVQEESVNKQLNDKERVAAALENPNLLEVVNKCVMGEDE